MRQFQVLPQAPGFGQQLGQQLGAGLGAGINQGIAQRLEGFQRQRQMESQIPSLEKLGLSREDAVSVLNAPEKLQKPLTAMALLQKMSPQTQQNGMPEQPSQQNRNLSPEQRKVLGAFDPSIAKVYQEEEKLQQRAEEKGAERHFSIAKKTLESTAERAEALPQKEMALENMMNAIEQKNLGFFTRDNLAELTGIEGLRSPEGAVFKTAGKEFFLGSLKRAGARPNQWVEQQISDMLTKVGRSTEANLSVSEALKTELDVEKKQIELTNRIADEQEKKYGHVRRDLSSEVMKELTPYAKEKQKELESTLRNIKEKYEPSNKEGILMYDPKGNLRRVPNKQFKEAKDAGYRQAK